jgi:hypothetical protein
MAVVLQKFVRQKTWHYVIDPLAQLFECKNLFFHEETTITMRCSYEAAGQNLQKLRLLKLRSFINFRAKTQ